MCGRTALATAPSVLAERFGVSIPDAYAPRQNIAPSEALLAVRNDQPTAATELTWGFLPEWADAPTDGPTPINARSETVEEKRLFSEAFSAQRCLLLADGFYEWAGPERRKQPYRIERVDGAPYAYAGLWSHWRGDDAERWSCVILTTEANETVGAIHDRMPVMLEPGEEQIWLDGAGPEAWRSVFDPYPYDYLRGYPVSTQINDSTYEGPACTTEIGSQSGLDDSGG